MHANQKAIVVYSTFSFATSILFYMKHKTKLKRKGIKSVGSFITLFCMISIIYNKVLPRTFKTFFYSKVKVIQLSVYTSFFYRFIQIGALFYDFVFLLFFKQIIKLLPKDFYNLIERMCHSFLSNYSTLYNFYLYFFKSEWLFFCQSFFVFLIKSPLLVEAGILILQIIIRLIQYLLIILGVLITFSFKDFIMEIKTKSLANFSFKNFIFQLYNTYVLIKILQYQKQKGIVNKTTFLLSHFILLFMIAQTSKNFVVSIKKLSFK